MATLTDSTTFETPATQRVSTQRVSTRRAGQVGNPFAATTLEQDLAIARTLARLMDSQFQIGPVKFGLDSIIGLLPIAGDAASMAIGLYPIFLARKHKLGRVVMGRMAMNLGLDFIGGIVPLAGDALDVVFKANLKNLRLLEAAVAKRG